MFSFHSNPIVHIINNVPPSNEGLLNLVIPAALGIIGTLSGILVSEYFKRKDRVALYAESVFKKRLDIYEKLYFEIQEAYRIADSLLDNKKLSATKKKEIWEPISLKIAEYCDEHNLYLNHDVIAHCVGALVSVDDYLEMSYDKVVKVREKYFEDRNACYNLIKEDSGLKRLDLFFNKVNKPKLTSSIIDYMNELRKRKSK